PGALVIPNLNDTQLVVPLIPPGYEFMDRFNQLDLKFAKLFKINSVRMTGQFEIFNALNASSVIALRGGTGITAAASPNITATGYSLTAASAGGTFIGTPNYHQPGDIPQGRLFKFGMQIKW